MRTRGLDWRVRREAKGLVRSARVFKDTSGQLDSAIANVANALAAHDLQKVRSHLPVLDELVQAVPKSHPAAAAAHRNAWLFSLVKLVLVVLAIRAFVVEAFEIPSSSMYPTLEINDRIFVNKFIYGLRIPWTNIKLFERSPSRGDVIVFVYPCEPDKDFIKRVIGVAGDTIEVRCHVVYVNGKPLANHLVDASSCQYEDRDESGVWAPEPTPCSRYEETVDGVTHQSFHDPERPQNDADPTFGDEHDFPQRKNPFPPSCPGIPPIPAKIVETKPGGTVGPCEQQLHYVVPSGYVFAMGDNRNHSNDSRSWGPVPLGNIKGKAMFLWLAYGQSPFWEFWHWHASRIGNFVR